MRLERTREPLGWATPVGVVLSPGSNPLGSVVRRPVQTW